MSKELNWVEAAQAIEDGKDVEIYSSVENRWHIAMCTVHKSRTYRIAPREFKYGWYRYNSPFTSEQFILYTEEGWYGLSLRDNRLRIEIDESKVGEKVC